MSSSQKQAQLKARQDTLRQEVNLLLGQNKYLEAIVHYQTKCACSRERAMAYVEELRRERFRNRREEIMMRTHAGRLQLA